MATMSRLIEAEVTLHISVYDNLFDEGELKHALAAAIRHESQRVRTLRDEFLSECQQYESRYNFSSDEFLVRFESGELGGDADFFLWYGVKQSYDRFERRYQILQGITIPE